MAQIVAAIAASHAPTPFLDPHAAERDEIKPIKQHYLAMGQALAEAQPETVVVVTNEHLHAFSLANMPAICIGMADSYRTPYEEWIKVERRTLRGDPELGQYLVEQAYEDGFDPSYSLHMPLDHGTYTPFYFGEVDITRFKVVPIIVNGVQKPMPTMRRCLELGRFLGRALNDYPGLDRVALLGTGGLSHDIGSPNMGLINEAFDREFLRLLQHGSADDLVRYAANHVHEAGNGAEEVRNWIVLKGAMESAPVDVKLYAAVPSWLTGLGIAVWQTEPAMQWRAPVLA